MTLNNADSQVQFEMLCECGAGIEAICLAAVFLSSERNERYGGAARVFWVTICFLFEHEAQAFVFFASSSLPVC